MTIFHFVILSLCVYRITILLSRDACPFHICSKLRALDKLKVLKCPFCASLWISTGVNLAYYFSCSKTEPLILLALIFAMSAISIFADRTFTADYLAK